MVIMKKNKQTWARPHFQAWHQYKMWFNQALWLYWYLHLHHQLYFNHLQSGGQMQLLLLPHKGEVGNKLCLDNQHYNRLLFVMDWSKITVTVALELWRGSEGSYQIKCNYWSYRQQWIKQFVSTCEYLLMLGDVFLLHKVNVPRFFAILTEWTDSSNKMYV